METKTLNKSVAFAYFSDGEFLGWYADTSGSLRESPKLYSDSDSTFEIIERNFQYKLKRVNETSFDTQKDKVKGLAALSLLIFDSEDKLRGRNIELRATYCPEYDGSNQDFSRKVDKVLRKNHIKLYHKWCKELGLEAGIEKGSNIGIGLIDNFKRFKKAHPRDGGTSWVYADRDKVNEWSANEPTEFISKFVYNF